ncbi:hypothetical protein LKD27_09935 [Faecalibacterium sp. CLA-AA-H283]|uniref:hypothetical protein n=1 Tax=Faecalibacterium TaxID=216851 RepID=UPI001D0E7513|nr:hypothetical protein [Faecalibacterium hominis (ex Afrizal et al. 2022)]MCC2140010.1 hypothetical protein [Faecalibacterium hominis (ex Afrizal et al. 2022)]
MKKRLISLLVALCMAVTLLPVSAITAWAEEGDQLRIVDGYPVGSGDNHDRNCSGDGWSYDGTDKVLTIAPENPTTYDLKECGNIRLDPKSILCSAIIGEHATIENGKFWNAENPGSSITNDGTITSGIYSMPVINHGTITGGMFKSTVTNNGTIKGGIFHKKPEDGQVADGYTLKVNSQQNGSYESYDAEISYFGNSGYVIPNSNHNTSISIYIFFRDSQAILFPIDVTFGDTHCLLEDWAPSARYYDNGSGYFSVTFTAPHADADTVTLSILTRLVIDKAGYPVGTEGGTQDYSGNGWKFEKGNKTLTLENGDYSFWEQSEVQCPVIIKDGVTTIGGMFSKKVTNYGTVEKAVINNIFENRNTVKNSYFFNSSSSIAVTNHGGTMLDCLFENAPEGIESHTITEVEDYFISAELDGIAYQAMQTKFYFTGTPKLRVNLVKNGNVKPVTSINQKLNYGGLIEDYPVGYIFTVENDNEDVVLNAAPVPGKDDPKPDPKPEPKPEPEPEAPTYTLTVKGGTFTYNGGEAMTSASVPVDAEVKVTLNQSAVPEGMVFDLWAMDEASLLGNPAVAYNEESFTIPAGSVAKGSTVTVEAQYRDATIESEPSILGTAAIIGVAGAGTAVIVWQGYRIGMELYEKYFQPTPEETVAEQPAPEAPAAAAAS